MKHIHCLTALLVLFKLNTTAQIAGIKAHADSSKQETVLLYDTSALRIPGQALQLGIITVPDKGEAVYTRGLLHGNYGWTKFRVEVTGGSFAGGKLKITGDTSYKKNDSITVKVYTRKWLLGGKDKFLLTAKIPYDYETGIKILTKGKFSKAPGNHVQFGIKTIYDNKAVIEKWAPASKNLQDFVFAPEGSHISKSKGDLKIDNDPVKIINDKVQLIAVLRKHTAIADTLQIVLDYVASYQCNIGSYSNGHSLKVLANVYDDSIIHAKLMRIHVGDSIGKKMYDYIINTAGGSIHISSSGANGLDGTNGFIAAGGMRGSDGALSTYTETTTNADGTTSTNTITTQGPGGDGGNGDDGGNGTNGDDGYDGGNITVMYNAAAKPFINLITATSIPGAGGQGGLAGKGGEGGSGGAGNPPGSRGRDGHDGFAGDNGANGNSGKVVFVQQ